MEEFEELQSGVTSALISTTRSASTLAVQDIAFHRSLSPTFASALEQQNARLLRIASRILDTATANTETVRPTPSLKDVEDLEGNWKAVVDVVDSLLERADTALDEFTGAVKRLSPGLEEQVCCKANGVS
jgi:exosome complex exonuclease RRP6